MEAEGNVTKRQERRPCDHKSGWSDSAPSHGAPRAVKAGRDKEKLGGGAPEGGDTHTHRHTDTDTQTNTDTHRYTYRDTHTHTGTHTQTHTHR